MPEKFPEPVYHPEPIKILQSALKRSAPKARLSKPTERIQLPVRPEPKKDKIDKALDVMEDVEKKIQQEGLLKVIGKGIKNSAKALSEALIEKPVKKAFGGAWEGLKNQFKKPEEFEKAEFEKIEMPKDATMETEAESMIDLSRPEVPKKDFQLERKELSVKEKKMLAISRLNKKQK